MTFPTIEPHFNSRLHDLISHEHSLPQLFLNVQTFILVVIAITFFKILSLLQLDEFCDSRCLGFKIYESSVLQHLLFDGSLLNGLRILGHLSVEHLRWLLSCLLLTSWSLSLLGWDLGFLRFSRSLQKQKSIFGILQFLLCLVVSDRAIEFYE